MKEDSTSTNLPQDKSDFVFESDNDRATKKVCNILETARKTTTSVVLVRRRKMMKTVISDFSGRLATVLQVLFRKNTQIKK